jgi:hypothetical protein
MAIHLLQCSFAAYPDIVLALQNTHDLVDFGSIAETVEHDVRAEPGKSARYSKPNSAGRTGHDRGFTFRRASSSKLVTLINHPNKGECEIIVM